MLLGELYKLSQKVTNYGGGCPAGISTYTESNKFGHLFVGKLLPRSQVPQQSLVSLTNPGSTTLRTIFCLTNSVSVWDLVAKPEGDCVYFGGCTPTPPLFWRYPFKEVR